MSAKSDQYLEYANRIHKALDFINDRLGEEIHLEDVARSAFFSPYHFHRIFTGFMGETPDDYTRRLRLEKAAKMIKSRKNLTITDIALNCGFSSSPVFSRNFKKYFKLTPIEWRNGKYHRIGFGKRTDSSPQADRARGRSFKGELKVEVVAMKPFRVAFMRHLGGYDSGTKRAFKNLMIWGESRGLIDRSTKIIGMPLDNPDITPQDKCRFYACISINADVQVGGKVSEMAIPGGLYARTGFSGKAEEIDDFYGSFFREWLPYSGFVTDDFPAYQLIIRPEGSQKNLIQFDSFIKIKPL
jgi:AraC family transcriptional regulator